MHHHPAVLMWRGYEEEVGRYGLTIGAEWTALGSGIHVPSPSAPTSHSPACARSATQADVATPDALLSCGETKQYIAAIRAHCCAKTRSLPRLVSDVSDDLEYVWPARA